MAEGQLQFVKTSALKWIFRDAGEYVIYKKSYLKPHTHYSIGLILIYLRRSDHLRSDGTVIAFRFRCE